MQRIKRDIYLQRLTDREQNGLVKILNAANYRFLRMTRLKKPSLFVF